MKTPVIRPGGAIFCFIHYLYSSLCFYVKKPSIFPLIFYFAIINSFIYPVNVLNLRAHGIIKYMSEEIKTIKKQILPILKKAGVLKSSLFGSVVRGEANKKSDIDILVELPKDKTMFDLMDLEEKLETKLGKNVDLITYRSVHHLLRDIIFKEQIQIL